MATFPGSPPNSLGVKVELLVNTTWTDITQWSMLRNGIGITGLGRADESSTIGSCQLTITLKNTDGRFTPRYSSGAYYPYIVRNAQIRVSVSATSVTGVAYSGYRFWGEISEWPVGNDISQHDIYVQVVASGIWRRISQSTVTIGSSHSRYVKLLTGTLVPAAWWPMEDGNGSVLFVLGEGTGTNMVPTGTPSYAADNTSFPGSDAIPQLNAARLAANCSSGATPTANIIQFALSVPAAGDSTASTFSGGGQLLKVLTSGTIATLSVTVTQAGQLSITGSNSGGTQLFTGTITTKVAGVPVYVSIEITSGLNWAMRIIKPNGASVLDQVSGTVSGSVSGVTQVQVSPQGRFSNTALGQLGIWYVLPTLTTAAAAIGGHAGELAVARFQRLCTESNISSVVIGSGGAAMGPQTDDTLANILQSIENTDGGLLYEPTGQFGLGYRTLASLQNQSAAATLSYAAGVLGAPLAPTYDDSLVVNQWTVTNYDNYSALAQLTSGALSVQAPPNGMGSSYSKSKSINANSDTQANTIAQQLLFEGTVDDLRYPVVVLNMARSQAGPLFSAVPSLRIGDYFQITSLPAFLGGGTAKQLAWGYSETITQAGVQNSWIISFNAIPETPFETSFSPGTYSVTQASAASVAAGSTVGSSVSGAQLGAGAVPATALSTTISARAIGGITQYIGPATPYDWSFAVTGTPSDATYFTCTEAQSLPIAAGDTFTNSGGLGGPFTVTSVEAVAGGLVNVHFTPNASSVMSSGTVSGGKNGDQWINTSGGNQVSVWASGAWSPITWNAASVLAASSITAAQIAAGTITAAQIAAGIVIAGVVNGTTISGATIIADGTSGEILVYSGTPASGNLIGSWSGASGSDGLGNSYPAGLAVEQGGLVLFNQSGAPGAVSGASSFYSSVAGRPRYVSSAGSDTVLERSVVNVSQFTVGNSTTFGQISADLSYLGNEGNQSSEYEIEIRGNGVGNTTSAQTLTFQLYIDGTLFGGGATAGATFFSAGTTGLPNFRFTYNVVLFIVTAGAGGTATASGWGVLTPSGNSQPSGNCALTGLTIGATFDSTSNHTLEIRAAWGGTATGQTLTTYRTKLARRM